MIKRIVQKDQNQKKLRNQRNWRNFEKTIHEKKSRLRAFARTRAKNTTKLYMSGNHNSKVTRHKIIRVVEQFQIKSEL